ncbi:unnamed protein product [Dicrocoelium dendriticum]|nr:unnamed protein product [Dicrocoelium dendriticum]
MKDASSGTRGPPPARPPPALSARGRARPPAARAGARLTLFYWAHPRDRRSGAPFFPASPPQLAPAAAPQRRARPGVRFALPPLSLPPRDVAAPPGGGPPSQSAGLRACHRARRTAPPPIPTAPT